MIPNLVKQFELNEIQNGSDVIGSCTNHEKEFAIIIEFKY